MQAHRLHGTTVHHINLSKCAPAPAKHKAAARQVSTAVAGKSSSAAQEEASLELKRKHQADDVQILATAASAVLLPLACVADEATAATVCLDVPDWIADWRGTLLHSPVVAVGAAGLALVLFPKLIRVRRAAPMRQQLVVRQSVFPCACCAATDPTALPTSLTPPQICRLCVWRSSP